MMHSILSLIVILGFFGQAVLGATCTKGTYAMAGTCVPCTTGTTTPGAGTATSQMDCTDCLSGYTKTSIAGVTVCTSSGGGGDTCTKGSYAAAGTCIPCTIGTTTPGAGTATSQMDCTDCLSGYTKTVLNGMTVCTSSGGGGATCTKGSYAMAGTCIPCTTGSTTPGAGTATSQMDCTVCMTGYTKTVLNGMTVCTSSGGDPLTTKSIQTTSNNGAIAGISVSIVISICVAVYYFGVVVPKNKAAMDAAAAVAADSGVSVNPVQNV